MLAQSVSVQKLELQSTLHHTLMRNCSFRQGSSHPYYWMEISGAKTFLRLPRILYTNDLNLNFADINYDQAKTLNSIG